MRPPSHQPRPHLPTALRSLNRRASSSLQWDPPTLIPCSPPAGGAAAACPCAGRGLRGGSTINTSAPIPANNRPAYAPAGVSEISITQRPSSAGADTPPRIPPPRSVIPAPDPSFLRPVRHSCARSVIPAPGPSFLRPVRHSCARSVIPAPGPSFLRPVRHSCAGRNPCDHHRINHARTFRRPSDPSIGALPPRCSGTPPPPPKRHTPSHLTTPQPLGLMPPTE